jgi:transcriptional repressor NrdR
LKCGKRFNTIEKVEDIQLRVIKKDGSRESFDRDKVRRGIEKACQKRPVSSEKIDKMLAKYEEPSYSEGIDVIIYV